MAYADGIDIIGLNNRTVSSAFPKLDKEAKRMGLVVNEDKTKYLLSSNKQSSHSRIGTHVTVDSYNFEVVKDFVYLGTSINTDNNVSLEIQRRISLANKCYFGLGRQFYYSSPLSTNKTNTLQDSHHARPNVWRRSLDDDNIR